jgi:hypothetical protein
MESPDISVPEHATETAKEYIGTSTNGGGTIYCKITDSGIEITTASDKLIQGLVKHNIEHHATYFDKIRKEIFEVIIGHIDHTSMIDFCNEMNLGYLKLNWAHINYVRYGEYGKSWYCSYTGSDVEFRGRDYIKKVLEEVPENDDITKEKYRKKLYGY